MPPRFGAPGGWPVFLWLALVLAVSAAGKPAGAQSVSLSAEPSLGGYYKPNRWLPLTVVLDNQGQTADVEVSAELKDYRGPGPEYRLMVEQLPAPARRRYTLYLLPQASFSSRPLDVQLIQGRRVVGQQTVNLRPLNSTDRIVAVLDKEEGALNTIAGLQLSAGPAGSGSDYPNNPRFGRAGQAPRGQAQVAYLKPEVCPDRSQGFDAVDLLVIGDVSARDLSAAQQKAISDWVQTGGTLVIAGGANGLRLGDPFFRDLLPVQVAGTLSIPRLVGMQRFSFKQAPPTGLFVITQATPKPGAAILATADGARLPLVVEGRAGAGRVFFMAFDYAKPPVRMWEGAPEFWSKILAAATSETSILAEIDPAIDDYALGGRWQSSRWRLGDACQELSQMDPPKFAWIGLFLLSYIIVLVPVNYYVLKKRDQKEYAWVTTPVIVLAFSLLAYLVGYGMKGGQVLLAKVGVVEAATGSSVGAAYHYVGLFSPRKTSYDVATPGAAGTLSEWHAERGNTPRPISIVESEPFRAVDMNVDMWSMRTLRLDNAIALGRGVTAHLSQSVSSVAGTVTNNTPYDLEDCQVVFGGQSVSLGDLARGASRPIPTINALGTSPWRNTLLPSNLVNLRPGNSPLDRMKRAMLQPLVSYNPAAAAVDGPVLVAWTTRPLVNVTVNGRRARELNVGLLLIHLR